MSKIRENFWASAHHAAPLRGLRAAVLAGLVVLLTAGCQGGDTSERAARGAAIDGGQESDTQAQTLGPVRKLIDNCDVTLSKLADEQEAYADAGNEKGERLMAQAADNVRDIKDAASSLQDDVPPGGTTAGGGAEPDDPGGPPLNLPDSAGGARGDGGVDRRA